MLKNTKYIISGFVQILQYNAYAYVLVKYAYAEDWYEKWSTFV
jgi:hypothetical protein